MISFISGPQFARQFVVRFCVLIVLTVGFPVIVYGLMIATNAGSVSGAGGALAVIAGFYLKPIIFFAFVISLLRPCWQRMNSLGLRPYWGLLVPLLFLVDTWFFVLAGAHWGVGFVLGSMGGIPPYHSATALVLVAAMALASSPSNGEPRGLARFGGAGKVTGVLAVSLTSLAVVRLFLAATLYLLLRSMTLPAREAPPLRDMIMKFAWSILTVQPLVCLLFCLCCIWLVLLSRKKSGEEHPRTGVGPTIAARTTFGKR